MSLVELGATRSGAEYRAPREGIAHAVLRWRAARTGPLSGGRGSLCSGDGGGQDQRARPNVAHRPQPPPSQCQRCQQDAFRPGAEDEKGICISLFPRASCQSRTR